MRPPVHPSGGSARTVGGCRRRHHQAQKRRSCRYPPPDRPTGAPRRSFSSSATQPGQTIPADRSSASRAPVRSWRSGR